MPDDGPLTAMKVKGFTARPGERDVKNDTLVRGLHLRVSGVTSRRPTVEKVWYHRYYVNGKERRRRIGAFPAMTLSHARRVVRSRTAKLDAGEDPDPIDTGVEDVSFRAMAAEVLEAKKARTSERTYTERERILQKDLLPSWGDRAAGSITRREVVTLVQAIADRGAPISANRTLALIKVLFNGGLRRGWPGLDANPAHLAEPPGKEGGRDRWLTLDEIGRVWLATEGESVFTRSALRLAILTAARMGSIKSMRWADVDIERGRWTIPQEHFKGRRPHLVPLGPESIAVIEELSKSKVDDVWVFPSRQGAKKGHVTNLAGAVTRVRERSGTSGWSPHDLRTTFRTHATRSLADGGLGVRPEIADLVLGHAEGSLGWRRYTGDRVNYRHEEKRNALRAWGAFVSRCCREENAKA